MGIVEGPGVRIADCRSVVQRLTQLCEADMLGDSRQRRYSGPRQMAMALAREFSGASLAVIGKHFRRDHSTVLHAIRRVAAAERANPDFKITMDGLRRMLTAQPCGASEKNRRKRAS